MSVTAPEYSARILGAPDVPVSLRTDAGDITLDVASAPHVSGVVTLAMPDPTLLDDLDPRDSRRLVVEAGGRAFDLGIRHAVPDRAGGTVRVTLASDEALLDDFSQLLDDRAPRALESSLRAVTDYVLDKIGAHLEPGGPDGDVTAYWPVTNLHPNGLPASSLGYGAGAGATGVAYNASEQRVQWTSTAADSNLICASTLTSYRVTPGKTYTFIIEWATGSAGRTARPAIQWRNNGSASTLATIRGEQFSYDPANYQRMVITATAPAGAEFAYPLVLTSGNTSGSLHVVRRCMFYEGSEPIAFFTGATPDDAHYDYAWADPAAPNASSAVRTPILERRPESTIWPAGTSGLAFLRPLLLSAGLRLVCDEQRRWTIRDISYRAPGQQQFRIGVNIVTADEEITRDDERWFDGMVVVYTWSDSTGGEQTRTDTYALPGATKIIRRDVSAPYPGPGRAEYAVRRAQGTGRTVTATKQATWNEHAEQTFTALLGSTPIQVGIAEKVVFDLARNEVTTTSRTTDTPVGAIDLLPGTINTLPGTINNL